MKKTIIILSLLLCALATRAQFKEQRSWLVVTADNNQYGSVFDKPVERVFKIDKPSFSIAVEHYLSKSFNVAGQLSVGKINDYQSNLPQLVESNYLRANLASIQATGIYKFNNGFFLRESARLSPFIEAGVGMAYFNEHAMEGENGGDVLLPVAVGAKYRFTDNMQFLVKVTQNVSPKMNYKRLSVGFSFALKGKLDSDKDGIYDFEDGCPQEPGLIENNGCPLPDTDEDGVLDMFDACPLVAGTVNGCPDSDEDGVIDSADNCPTVFGLEEFQGCPDTDKDGIIDSLDSCPLEAGTDNGCPVVTLPLTLILFEFSSEVIPFAYRDRLDELAAMLRKMPEVKLSIYGYTDSIDDHDVNIALSRARASAIRNYLIERGANGGRLISQGFGEEYPVGDNETVLGRAKNRRVEIKIIK